MAKPVQIAYLKYRDERPHGVEERLGRRSAAAVVRHDEQRRAQRERIAREQRALGRGLDVGRKQRGRVLVRRRTRGHRHAQHATVLVRAARQRAGVGPQHVEVDAVPLPVLAGRARQRVHAGRTGRRPQRMRGRESADERLDADLVEHGRRTARVIGIVVADHQRVDARYPPRLQIRHDDPLARARRFRAGARIEQQRVPRRFDEHGRALPDIERGDPKCAVRRSRRRGQQQRQPRERRGPAQRPAARRETPRDAERRAEKRPCPRLRDVQHCPRRSGYRIERRREQFEQPMRDAQRRRIERCGQQDAGEHDRRHEHADPWNRERIRERTDQRHLREPVQRERRERERHGELHARAAAYLDDDREHDASERRADARLRVPRIAVDRNGIVDTAIARLRRERKQDRRDRAERQPESRRHDRPRIDDQHRAERPRERLRPRDVAPAYNGGRACDEHPQRALHRHVESGERRIRGRRRQRAQQRDGRRRHRERRRPSAPADAAPHRRRETARERRDEREMQPGDRDQMRRAGATHQPPVGLAHGVLRARRQRDDNAAMRRAREHRVDPRMHAPAQTLDRDTQTARILRVTQRALWRGDVTRRAHAARKKRDLAVAQTEIAARMRLFEPHRQLPSRARFEHGHRRVAIRPCQTDGRRQLHRSRAISRIGRRPRFDREPKARSVLAVLRQTRDISADAQLARLPRGRQCPRQPQIGTQRRIVEAHARSSDPHGGPAARPPPAAVGRAQSDSPK